MPGITLEIAQKHLDAWLEAELACTTNQSYTIGRRALARVALAEIRRKIKYLTRADLAEIRNTIKYWAGIVAKLEAAKKYGGRNRTMRIMPRDL